MKPKTYAILSEAIEIGIRFGYARAFKHTDSPSEASILEDIHDAIMVEVCGRFSFDEEDN
jgi:hypothetical protein